MNEKPWNIEYNSTVKIYTPTIVIVDAIFLEAFSLKEQSSHRYKLKWF